MSYWKSILWKKVIVLTLLFPFCVSLLTLPEAFGVDSHQDSHALLSLKRSALNEWGSLQEAHFGSNGKTIFYIQDAHDSLEAQENIAKLVQYLVEEKNVKTVFVEGFQGEVPTDDYFNPIEDPELKRKIAYFLLDQLHLGGADYAHINREKDFKLLGIDNLFLYFKNLEAYQNAALYLKETQHDLKVLRNLLRILADRYFSREMKNFLKLKKRFQNEELPPIDYLNRLAQKIPAKQKENLIERRPGIRQILTLASRQDQGLSNEIDSLDAELLLKELRSLEASLANLMTSSSRERKIYEYLQTVQLLIRLTNLEISEQEFLEVLHQLEEVDTQKIAEFVTELTGRSLVVSKQWESYILEWISFYRIVMERDFEIAKTLKKFKDESHETNVALVFGGFHKDNILSILQELDYSYQVITPTITHIDKRHQEYYKNLLNQSIPFTSVPSGLTTGLRQLPLYLSEVFLPEELLAISNFAGSLESLPQAILNRRLRKKAIQIRSEMRSEHSKKDSASSKTKKRTRRRSSRYLKRSQVPEDLGLNIRRSRPRKNAPRRRSRTIPDILNSAGEVRHEKVEQIRRFAKKHRLTDEKSIELQIHAVLTILKKNISKPNIRQVNIGYQLDRPILLRNTELTIDSSFLSLPVLQLERLLRFGFEHVRLSSRVIHEKEIVREMVAYVEDAQNRILRSPQSTKSIDELIQSFSDLSGYGWDTRQFQLFYDEISIAVRMGKFAHLRDLNYQYQRRRRKGSFLGARAVTRFYEARNFRRVLADSFQIGDLLKLIPKGRSQTLPLKRRELQELNDRHYWLPNALDIRNLKRETRMRKDQAVQLLNANIHLLPVVRFLGAEVLTPYTKGQTDFRPMLHGAMAQSEDWVLDRLEEDMRASSPDVRGGHIASGWQFLRLALGEEPIRLLVQSAISNLNDDEWSHLLAFLGSLIEDFTKSHSLSFYSTFVSQVKNGRWRDGMSFLRENGNAEELTSLLNYLYRHSVPEMPAGAKRTQSSRDQYVQSTYLWLMAKIFQRWGIASGLSLRRPYQADTEKEDTIHARKSLAGLQRQIVEGIRKKQEQALQNQGRELEAILLLAERYHLSFDENYMRRLRLLMAEALPNLFRVPLYEPSETMATERALFRYLLAVDDVAALQKISSQLAGFVAYEGNQGVTSSEIYEQRIIEKKMPDTQALALITGDMLTRYYRSTRTETEVASERAVSIVTALSSLEVSQREQVVQQVIHDAEGVERLLRETPNESLRNSLARNLDPAFIAQSLEERKLSVDEIRDLLRKVVPGIASEILPYLKRQRDVYEREVYEKFVRDYPDEIEDLMTGDLVPNHYQILGIPRNADATTIQRSHRRLSFLYHPDRFMNESVEEQERAEEQAKLIFKANKTLSDSEERLAYEQKIPNDARLYPPSLWLQEVQAARSELRSKTEKNLPVPVREALQTASIVPSAKGVQFITDLVVSGKRSEDEVTAAVVVANEHSLGPDKVLMIAEKNQLTVPLTGEMLNVTGARGSTKYYVMKWARQIWVAQRGLDPQDDEALALWETATKEDKAEAMVIVNDLKSFAREIEHLPAAKQFASLSNLIKLYNALGESTSIEEVQEVVLDIIEIPIQEDEWTFKKHRNAQSFDSVGELRQALKEQERLVRERNEERERYHYKARFKQVLAEIERQGGLFFSVPEFLTEGRVPMDEEEEEIEKRVIEELGLEFSTDVSPPNLRTRYQLEVELAKEQTNKPEEILDVSKKQKIDIWMKFVAITNAIEKLLKEKKQRIKQSTKSRFVVSDNLDLFSPLLFESRTLESAMAEDSHTAFAATFFFSYHQIKNSESFVNQGLFILASVLGQAYSQNGVARPHFVIYDVQDPSHEALNRFRELGVSITTGPLKEAFWTYGQKQNSRNVHVFSEEDDLLKSITDFSGRQLLMHVRITELSEIWAAYLRALVDHKHHIPGMVHVNGYYEVASEFLRSELRAYQNSLVVSTAA